MGHWEALWAVAVRHNNTRNKPADTRGVCAARNKKLIHYIFRQCQGTGTA
jgi:hypothetical protein